jgi:hypothetical protein
MAKFMNQGYFETSGNPCILDPLDEAMMKAREEAKKQETPVEPAEQASELQLGTVYEKVAEDSEESEKEPTPQA